MVKLKAPLLLILLSVLFYSCEKEYSLEGHPVSGTAIFTFSGAPGACTNAVITGAYEPGIPVGATNTATVSVDVTVTGTYNIATPTVNGILFSGTGSFTTTGIQTVVLAASGVPASAGTFSYSPGSNTCSFPVTFAVGGGSSGGTATYTLSGAPGACTGFTASGNYAVGLPLGATNLATINVNVTAIGTYIITTNTVNGMSFSGSGSFTATGTQPVQLTGTGTPLVGGNFDFVPGTNGCTFSITVTGGGGTAVFTYNGAPGTCTNAVPAGTYSAGTAVTSANTVAIDVNVTSIGTWTITTPVVNGFSFSGSGTFTATGAQTVTLVASGTPGVDGVYSFTPTPNGCAFSITVDSGTPATDFLKCTINGTPRVFNVNIGGTSIDPTVFEFYGSETSAATSANFDIGLTKTPVITTGDYERASVTNFSTFCIAVFNDGVSTTGWATALGTQTGGFTVKVTTFTPNRIAGTFSGTLYDQDGQGAGEMTITNGEFSIPY